MIEVKNLVKKYGNHLAVDHLSFTVEKGQIYGFLGPNGAGKSTTMNIMTGYIASTEGEVVINGHDILEEPEEAKKCIGYLPELPPLYMDMTVGEYLKFAAQLKKIPKAQRASQIEEIMELVGIKEMERRLIKNLSKGYKQRVGLAQAILGYPEIIILDEPMVGLDPKQIIEIRELIRKLSENHTIILSSHILSEVSEICDYIMIINKGKLVASDTTENLSHMTFGSNTLDAVIKGDKERLEGVLRGVEEIQELEWNTSADGECAVSIKTAEHVDLREKLFYLMAANQMPILEMKSTKVSLEDVFLELTQNDSVAVTESGDADGMSVRNDSEADDVNETESMISVGTLKEDVDVERKGGDEQ